MPTTAQSRLLVTLLLSAQFTGLATAQFRDASARTSRSLSAPRLILAAGKPIDVTTGHAAPYVLDFDGDGKRDLLVGEFGDGRFANDELPEGLSEGWKKNGRFANGRVRIYKNRGSNKKPRYTTFEYLQAGGGDATVPIT